MWQVVGVLFLSPTAHTHAHTHPLQVVEVLFLSPTAHTPTPPHSVCFSHFSGNPAFLQGWREEVYASRWGLGAE